MIGQVFSGRYEILEKFSQDEFSQTYLAQDRKREGCPICLVKELIPPNGDAVFLQQIFRLFQQQAEILKQLGHSDRFPKLLAYFQYQGKFYLVQEFIEGKPLLDELVPGKPLSEVQVINLLAELLESLALIHFYHINHGNIHPNNVIRRKSNQQLVLTDLTWFKQMLSQNSTLSGLAGYQRQKITAETCLFKDDIYAVGMIAIQAITGIPAEKIPKNPKTNKLLWEAQTQLKNRQLISLINTLVSLEKKAPDVVLNQALKIIKNLQEKSQPQVQARKKTRKNGLNSRELIHNQVLKILGLVGTISALAFFLLNPTTLYWLRYPQVLFERRGQGINQSKTGALDIIESNSHKNIPISEAIAKQVQQIAKGITIQIHAQNQYKGSGAIVAKSGNQYYVLTARHVVNKIDTYSVVTPDGKSYSVENSQVRKFAGLDLAILEFTSEVNYPVAILANVPFQHNIHYNETRWVFLSGWPISLENQAGQYEFNIGQLFSQEVSLLNITDASSINQGYELLYTNFSKAGVSGGPILDTQGRLIGIHGAARVDRVNKMQLGDSLGVPIQRFLDVVKLTKIPPESLKIESTPPAAITKITQVNEGKNQNDLSSSSVLTVSQPADKNNHGHWVNYGNQLWRMGLNEAAIQAFDEAIKIQPDFYPAWYLRGLVLAENQQYQEALTSLDRVLKIEPKFLQVWAEKGKILAKLGEYSQAVNSIEQAIKRNQKNLLFHWLHGNWLYRSKQYAKAIAAYNNALTIKPHPFAYYNRGVAHYLMHNYSQAIADYNQALQMNLKIGEIYLARSLAYTAQGNGQKAAQDLAKAKQLFCEQRRPECEKIQEK